MAESVDLLAALQASVDRARDASAYRRITRASDGAGAVERLAHELRTGDAETVRRATNDLKDFATGAEVAAIKRHLKNEGETE